MAFDSQSGTLACRSCGRQDNIAQFPDEYITNEFSEDEAVEYECENCGAVVITDQDTTATSCSFCGAGVVLGDRIVGKLAPRKVIPFKISKDEARDAFKKWCKNGRFTPPGFMTADRIKNITGMYVPFWMYDLNSKVQLDAIGKRVRTYTRGDYIYTETKHYDVHRNIDMYHRKVPVDASKKMNDEMMDKLEPYNYNDLEDFKAPYLVGYLAEKYNYDDKELYPRVEEKIAPFIRSYVNSTVSNYSMVHNRQEQKQTKALNSMYVLLPVWMVYYDFERQEHTFAMNGQTGKVVGKPPISKKKVAVWYSGIAVSAFVALKLVSFGIGGVLW